MTPEADSQDQPQAQPYAPTPKAVLPPAISARAILERPGQWFSIGIQKKAWGEGVWEYTLGYAGASEAEVALERKKILQAASEDRIFCPQRRLPGGDFEWLAIALSPQGQKARLRSRPIPAPRRNAWG